MDGEAMSYINQDPDIIIPFKGKQMVEITRFSWMQEKELEEGLSQIHARDGGEIASAACWCGAVPGACGDCQDMESLNPFVQAGKINIGSGEDANAHR